MNAGAPSARPHLTASLIAIAVAGLVLAVGLLYCERLERRSIHALAPEFSAEKLQGAVLQTRAFEQPDLLVLYGSSELVRDIPNNASQFFADYPTGFRVFPVGKPGTTSLAVLQKVAAVGEGVRGRKLAFSISPGWFFMENFDPSYYIGNFSDMQALELVFSSALSHELKRDVARRMDDFPKTLDDKWLLDVSVDCLAGDTWWDRSLFTALWPLGRLSTGVARAQDHFEAALHILDEEERLNASHARGLRALKWNDLLKRAAQFVNVSAVQAKRNEVARKKLPRGSRDKTFMQTMDHAREWTDFELLLRTIAELGAKPLLLSMPFEDLRLEVYGISADARTAYRTRLDELTGRYRFPWLDFREHDTDPGFSVDFLDHLSAEGWLYYNKALDDFFHDRLTSL